MLINPTKAKEHMFSIELNSKEHLKSVAFSNIEGDNILIEGFMGKLHSVNFTEGLMLEIIGANGILRMDLDEEEFDALLSQKPHRTRKPQKNSSKDGEGR